MQKLKAKPFALIGVSVNPHPPMKLEEVMEKEQLNWRSFDERSGIIAGWNHPVTPGYYLLDRNGVIRYKWSGYPGERALDAALDQLIRETEGSGSAPDGSLMVIPPVADRLKDAAVGSPWVPAG